jgi:uncharacterized repeat protein (TIGR03803 family)
MLRSTSHAAFAAMLMAGTPLAAQAASPGLTTLHAFSGADGAYPYQNDALPHGKFLYGTTSGGGANSDGVIYKLNPATGAEKDVYDFTGANDGCIPTSALTPYNGLLYGTTTRCGANDHGTVFSFSPMTGELNTVYSFNLGVNGDGGYPSGKLLAYGGFLWGVTQFGGADYSGILFKIDPATGAETVAYTFGAGTDASSPDNGVIEHGGILYGTAQNGGTNNGGAVYAFNPATGAETVLHSFGSFGGSDGYYPTGELLFSGGDLYGTTQNGGANSDGTIFKVKIATGAEAVLYSFTGGADGAFPYNALTPLKGGKASGQFYGVATQGGGSKSLGTIFMFDSKTNTLTPEYSFTGGADGGLPFSALTTANGLLFGNTSAGGADNDGTAFSFMP